MRRAVLLVAAISAATPAAGQRYLTGPGVALIDILPPAPRPGSPEEAADLSTFRATRVLEGTPRWRQAIGDLNEAVPAMLADFTPAAGRTLSPEVTPELTRLLTRMRGDVAAAVNAVKPVYARPRPFELAEGRICQPARALLGSPDYPSGHTSWGSAVSLVLAELIPARASEILGRGRDFGDSRAVCGAHSASAVMAGRQAAAAVVARLHGDPDFRKDMDSVRRELDPALHTMARIVDPGAGPIVVAHRGCHAAIDGLGSAPENSLKALDHCASRGIDVMETDVRMTRDGHLVMIHDATVDRTTDGQGRVADLTLDQLRALRLRDGSGGGSVASTTQRIATLEEMLAAAAGRIVLNLDIKDAVHAEVIAAVFRAGAENRVLVKASAGIASPPLAALPPYDRITFLPMLSAGSPSGSDLPAIVAIQASGPRRPIGFEVPRMTLKMLPATAAAARTASGRLWANSLWSGYIDGIGGDQVALARPDLVWGRMIRNGITIIQTDHPVPLRRFIDDIGAPASKKLGIS